jgi:hypothetical protein
MWEKKFVDGDADLKEPESTRRKLKQNPEQISRILETLGTSIRCRRRRFVLTT